MAWFSSRPKAPKPTKPPLIESPSVGDAVVLDEPELAAATRRYESESNRLSDIFENEGLLFNEIPDDVVETQMQSAHLDGLIDVAKGRNRFGDLKGAISSSVKALAADSYVRETIGVSRAWEIADVTFEIYSNYGDIPRAINSLDIKIDALKKLDGDFGILVTQAESMREQVLEIYDPNEEYPIETVEASAGIFQSIAQFCTNEYVMDALESISKKQSDFRPLQFLAYCGRTELIERLINLEYDVNQPDNDGVSPIHYAVTGGSERTVQMLIEAGADAENVVGLGFTPLMSAAEHNHSEIAKLLIEKGVDISFAGENGWTALHRASIHGNTKVADLLLEAGADELARDSDGNTPQQLYESYLEN